MYEPTIDHHPPPTTLAQQAMSTPSRRSSRIVPAERRRSYGSRRMRNGVPAAAPSAPTAAAARRTAVRVPPASRRGLARSVFRRCRQCSGRRDADRLPTAPDRMCLAARPEDGPGRALEQLRSDEDGQRGAPEQQREAREHEHAREGDERPVREPAEQPRQDRAASPSCAAAEVATRNPTAASSYPASRASSGMATRRHPEPDREPEGDDKRRRSPGSAPGVVWRAIGQAVIAPDRAGADRTASTRSWSRGHAHLGPTGPCPRRACRRRLMHGARWSKRRPSHACRHPL